MSGAAIAPDPGALPRGTLVTVGSDGVYRWSGLRNESVPHALFERASEVRRLCGSPIEEQIGARPFLPVGGQGFDQPLVASLVTLPISGDLAPYGWRLGPGRSREWSEAQAFHEQRVESARLAFAGYAGPLELPLWGPVRLAMGTFVAAGEKSLADPGLVRELPLLVSEGARELCTRLVQRVPQASPALVIDERGARAALRGSVRTASGYRMYPPLHRGGVSEAWGHMLHALGRSSDTSVVVGETAGAAGLREPVVVLVDSDEQIVRAALDAGIEACALDPLVQDLAAPSPTWERLAEAREAGVGVEFIVHADRLDAGIDHVWQMWRRLGYRASDAAGLTFRVSRYVPHPSHERVPPEHMSTARDVGALASRAPAIAERVAS